MKFILALSALVALGAAQEASVFGNENCDVAGLYPTASANVEACIREANLHSNRPIMLPTDGSCITPCYTSSVIQICGGYVPPGGMQRWVLANTVAITAERMMNRCGSLVIPGAFEGVAYELSGPLRIQVGQSW
ncbi:hypothetical protein BZA77DRAFT_378324 [Pyronema omphalodes]|nr:hypothetical protein BZA77DRAFT_378324 [Pyronema omphalodes]